jgi:hypothetical protein
VGSSRRHPRCRMHPRAPHPQRKVSRTQTASPTHFFAYELNAQFARRCIPYRTTPTSHDVASSYVLMSGAGAAARRRERGTKRRGACSLRYCACATVLASFKSGPGLPEGAREGRRASARLPDSKHIYWPTRWQRPRARPDAVAPRSRRAVHARQAAHGTTHLQKM